MATTPSALTDEQIAALLAQATAAPEDQQQQQQQPLRVRIGNQDLEGATPEELQAKVDGVLQQVATAFKTQLTAMHQQSQQQAPQAQQQQQQPGFSKENYAKLFLDDPIQAQEYLDEYRYGFAQPSNVLKTLVRSQGQTEQAIAVQSFMNSHQDYDATPENYSALQQTIQEFGLPWDYRGLSLAYSKAKDMGRIQQQQQQQDDFQQQQAPQQRRGVPVAPRGQGGGNMDSEILARFETLPAEKMREFLEQLQAV